MLNKEKDYRIFNREQFYIDKTEVLEKGIIVFPSIYVEGAAASGKTIAVKMLLAKHPEVPVSVLDMDEETDGLAGKLDELYSEMEQQESCWVIFENLNAGISDQIYEDIRKFIRKMPEKWRTILVSREKPAKPLLDLLWKREMEIISQEHFRFSRNDIRVMLDNAKSELKIEDVYERTEGWAGCVDIMLRLSARMNITDTAALCETYEIKTYIKEEIFDTLSEEEQKIVKYADICSWINKELCHEVWQIEHAEILLQDLERKGILRKNTQKGYWYLSKLFHRDFQSEEIRQVESDWEIVGKWYENHGFIKEALLCFKKMKETTSYFDCMRRNYDKVPFLNITYDEVIDWKESSPEICYLKGMYFYEHQAMEALETQIRILEEWKASDADENHKRWEIILNLLYVNTKYSLNEWIEMLELVGTGRKFHLYSILGNGITYLCGLRDLSGMFACSKKEENRRSRIWNEYLGEWEWKAYCLARMDYYMETRREDAIKEDDWKVLEWVSEQGSDEKNAYTSGQEMWQIRLVALYLYCKWLTVQENENIEMQIAQLEKQLLNEENEICLKNTEAIMSLYSPWRNEPERLANWLKHSEKEQQIVVKENTYIELCCRAKGYILLNYYEKAERILQKMISYLQYYRKNRFLAEVLFQIAVINWNKESRGLALRNTIESFLISGESRYVGFYTRYGKKGYEVLEAYVEWMKQNIPGSWRRKKKYNYGNVLRMPEEDYMEVILRTAKRKIKAYSEKNRSDIEERLTMMETIILQDLSRGLTNTEICQEQNLKMPTVKSHIYNVYKKLGVNNRVQAILKGKELGIVK